MPNPRIIRYIDNDVLTFGGTDYTAFAKRVSGGAQIFGACFLFSNVTTGGTIFSTFGDYGVPQVKLTFSGGTVNLTIYPGSVQDCVDPIDTPPPKFTIRTPIGATPDDFNHCPPDPLDPDPCCGNKDPYQQQATLFQVSRDLVTLVDPTALQVAGFLIDVFTNRVMLFGTFEDNIATDGNWLNGYSLFGWAETSGVCSCKSFPKSFNTLSSRNSVDRASLGADVTVINLVTNNMHWDISELMLLRFTDRYTLDSGMSKLRTYINQKYTNNLDLELGFDGLLEHYVSHKGTYLDTDPVTSGIINRWDPVKDEDLGLQGIVNPWTLTDVLSSVPVFRQPTLIELSSAPMLETQIPVMPLMYPMGGGGFF